TTNEIDNTATEYQYQFCNEYDGDIRYISGVDSSIYDALRQKRENKLENRRNNQCDKDLSKQPFAFLQVLQNPAPVQLVFFLSFLFVKIRRRLQKQSSAPHPTFPSEGGVGSPML